MITIVWTNTLKKAAGMSVLAGRVGVYHGPAWGETLSESVEAKVREAVLDGGINKPTTKGPARVRSETMLGSVNSRVTSTGGVTNVEGGFLANPPKYTIFQERGTRNRRITSDKPQLRPTKGRQGKGGVPAMLAIAQAEADIVIQGTVQGKSMLTAIRAEWNAI